MPVPVDFLLQAELDLIEFVPLQEHITVLESIIERVGRYPEIGVRLAPPDDFARAHGVERWVVYYEPFYVSDAGDQVERVEVLRIVPNAFATAPRLY